MAGAKNVVQFDTFRGCDFTNAGTDMDADKSPNCVNMIRDVPGKIRKRMGYYLDSSYGAQINGYHYLNNEKTACMHAGNNFYNVGGDTRSAYFEDYTEEHTDDSYIYLRVLKNGIIEKPKTPDAFVAVGASGYASGKYDKLVGGNQITNLRAVCYGAGRFIAVGDAGRAYFSTDKGKTWEKMSGLDTAKNYYGVTYDEKQSLFIAVGSKTIYCCRDGIRWYNACPDVTLSNDFYAVCGMKSDTGVSDDKVFALIVGNGAYAKLKKGNDNSDVVTVTTYSGVLRACKQIDTGLNYPSFIVAGDNILREFNFSSDSPSHADYNISFSANYYDIERVNDDEYYIVGTNGTLINIKRGFVASASQKLNNETNTLSGIAYNGEYYVITCSNTNYVYYSNDLKKWTKLKIKYSMLGVHAPIKEQEETFYKATVYFNNYTKVEMLPNSITEDEEDDTILKMTYSLKGYTSHVRSIVTEYYLSGNVRVFIGKTAINSVNSLYSGANDAKSISVPFSNKLYILDGKKMLEYDGYSINDVNSIAYIPTLTISKDPAGGGTDYEALNLIQPGFTEQFYVKSGNTATTFQMTFGELDITEVKAWVKNSNGEWVRKYENTDFTVDRITGIITFTSAVGASPVEGEDNVKITAYRTVDGYADRINKCTVACLFGVGGAQDRLFVSGNPDKKYLNYDWYSQQNDATYFGDTSYCTVGSTSSPVVGYAIINNYLAAFKGKGELHQNVVIRQGNLTESKPSFPLVNTLQGEEAIAKNSFQYLATEPIFLTRSGIMSITAQDITAEKYTQDRSFYLNGKLLKESSEDLEEATSTIYNDMYFLAVNGNLYILDGIQPMQTDKSLPYATRQYAGFYCTNIPARCIWVDADNVLCFGTDTGEVYKFYTDKENPENYNDAGAAIEASYETPDLGGKVFFKNKTFRYVAVRQNAERRTTMEIWVQRNGVWSMIKKDDHSANSFSFKDLSFEKFTFSTDVTQRLITSKLRLKKLDKTRIRLVNREKNEPFSIYDIGIEYKENGNHR